MSLLAKKLTEEQSRIQHMSRKNPMKMCDLDMTGLIQFRPWCFVNNGCRYQSQEKYTTLWHTHVLEVLAANI
jgi:hypothetical protein